MIEIELTTISLFQITFNRTAVWRRRYYLASAVSFVPLVSSRSFSPYCHLASPASTRSRSRNDYAPMITPFWKFHFFWPVLTFFFSFFKEFHVSTIAMNCLLKSSWEKTKSARWGVKRPCYWNSPLCLCFVCSLCCIISISRSEMELNSTDGQESIAFEIDKRNQNVCYIFCLVFSYNCGWNSLSSSSFFELKNNN